ncbi:MAG: Stealth CR1 domain-containing protein [Lachnospiraceae bacterium]|nr:Stealth CR1 domain-containing protein [Lachnospiraceae bacterium]
MSKPYPVDIVLTWVDGNDPEWEKQMLSFRPDAGGYKSSTSRARFRSWDNLQYIFRGIETFMPWVRTVHFVTWGHLPPWLNLDAEKLHIVRHDEFIPAEYLPTFNSNAILLNLFRIPGLAERFIFFNDDTFVIQPVRKTDYFVRGLPRDSAALTPFVVTPGGIAAQEMNNLEIINRYFSSADVRANLGKWLNPLYGSYNLRTLIFLMWKGINGVYEPHIPVGYLRSTCKTVWEKEFDVLDATSRNRFRTKADVSEWLFRQWQLMSGRFVPRDIRFGRYTVVPQHLDLIENTLKKPGRCKMLCINDNVELKDFETARARVNSALSELLPRKSHFER